ncbi:MAG: glycosyl transferase family 9 [Bacteroidetes bacterium CG23_combo_of_CG06-09_8_20_14_all_32_9]|nr:MAG: glycosyl transferase family 9 [Bacteroidetes bacterium CG23_combo_of_CG06-09_8_20_14_all_32_9]
MQIIISRIDKIGDVVLTLPLAGYLKIVFPECYIIFLGRKYTKPVIDACTNIDEFADWDNLSKMSFSRQIKTFKKYDAQTIIHVFPDAKISKLAYFARIANRIGTNRRIYHWLYVNKPVKLSRKKSDLHEAQLNLMLAKPLVADFKMPDLNEIPLLYGFSKFQNINNKLYFVNQHNKFNVILHPKSKGSAREWGLDRYAELIRLLSPKKFNIIIAGTNQEASQMEQLLRVYSNNIIDVTGKLSLGEYISLIAYADGLVACSTGPLHIAAAAGKYAIGLYAPMKPIFPQRWAPIGKNASFFVLNINCEKCRKSENCECIRNITAQEVASRLEQFYNEKFKDGG